MLRVISRGLRSQLPSRKDLNMRVYLLAGAAMLGLSLAGCNFPLLNPSATSISAQYALAAANSFDAIESAATAYLSLPPCTGVVAACRNQKAVPSIKKAVLAGRGARNQIEALLAQSGGAAIPVASYNNLQAAIATLQNLYSVYNIQAK
jgi:hypothetical protein